jgi:hypothetical protein
VAFIDTERGSEFYSIDIPERTVHPKAFDFDRLITRSLMETLEAVEEIDPKVYGVLVIDSITHLWEAARAAYNGKMLPNGGIPIQAWQQIKKPYKRLMSLFLDGSYHAILCGREGVVMEQDEDGEMRVTGTKLKAEGENAGFAESQRRGVKSEHVHQVYPEAFVRDPPLPRFGPGKDLDRLERFSIVGAEAAR